MKIILLFIALSFQYVSTQTDGFQIAEPTGFTVMQKCNQSVLYQVESASYDPPVQLLRLYGTDYQMGYDYGFLLAQQIFDNFHTFMKNMLPDGWEEFTLFSFLDWQWNNYLSKNVPQEFFDELRGITDGAADAGIPLANLYVTRVLTIANFPGDIQNNIEFLLLDEAINATEYKELFKLLAHPNFQKFKLQCSAFATWGSRTQGNALFSMRNLDWAPDTGIANHKLVTVYHNPSRISYATVGFAGVMGALTGMSSAGISVHEMGNDVDTVTFLGFPWTLRLRYIMSRAQNLNQALTIWKNTQNTLGMNHMLASASDLSSGHPAVALETMKGFTAFFYDNDPREAALNVHGVQMGQALPDAVWRTNHGYDPTIVKHELGPAKPGDDTFVRYWILHDSFQYYQNVQKPIGFYEAINVTSILGDKGGSHRESFYNCPNSNIGINVLSVTYQLDAKTGGTMYAAFERGTGSTWRPACCGFYVKLNMTQWW